MPSQMPGAFAPNKTVCCRSAGEIGSLIGPAWLGMLPGLSALAAMSVGAANGLAALLGCSAYRTCRIETDDAGLTQITLLGKQRLRWPQVANYFLTKERNGVVVGRGKRLRFSPKIAGYDELKAEIERKAAPGSRRLPRTHKRGGTKE